MILRILLGLLGLYLIYGASTSLVSGSTPAFIVAKYETNPPILLYEETPKRFLFEVLVKFGVGLFIVKKVLGKQED